jgi:hypothetical protein
VLEIFHCCAVRAPPMVPALSGLESSRRPGFSASQAAALRGMMNALAVFKDEVVGQNKVVDRTDLQVGFEELNDLMGMKFLDQLEEKYKGG